MIDVEYLKENDGLPSFIIPQRAPGGALQITGNGRVATVQDIDHQNILITRKKQVAALAAPVVSGVADPFAFMDFRVGYTDGVVSINRGRVYGTFWSPPIYEFVPRVFTIPAEEMLLSLTAEQDAAVYLSLPMGEYGNSSEFGAVLDLPYPSPAPFYGIPGSSVQYYHTYWNGFGHTEYVRRLALDDSEDKFAFAGDPPVPFDLSDFYFQLATIGPNFAVHHHHFGSVFFPSGFDHKISNSP